MDELFPPLGDKWSVMGLRLANEGAEWRSLVAEVTRQAAVVTMPRNCLC